jgi:hypothetical protein
MSAGVSLLQAERALAVSQVPHSLKWAEKEIKLQTGRQICQCHSLSEGRANV